MRNVLSPENIDFRRDRTFILKGLVMRSGTFDEFHFGKLSFMRNYTLGRFDVMTRTSEGDL